MLTNPIDIPQADWIFILRARMHPPTAGHIYLIKQMIHAGGTLTPAILLFSKGFFEKESKNYMDFFKSPFSIKQRENLIRMQLTKDENNYLLIQEVEKTIETMEIPKDKEPIQIFAGEEYGHLANGYFDHGEWIQTSNKTTVMETKKCIIIPRINDISATKVRKILFDDTWCKHISELKELIIYDNHQCDWKKILKFIENGNESCIGLVETIKDAKKFFLKSSLNFVAKFQEFQIKNKKPS